MPPRAKETRDQLQASHTPEAIRERLGQGPEHWYLSDFIYGAIDGAVTTFAVVAGVEGASLSTGIIIILGTANLVADGFSMAAANFLGTRAEQQQHARARRNEEHHLRVHPEGEREEIRQIFARKGLSGDALDQVVDAITADHKRWVDTMLMEEYGLPAWTRSAWRAALATFVAFVCVGAVPLAPILVAFFGVDLAGGAFAWSSVMTGVAFFAVGAMKSRFVDQRWWVAALETLGIGGAAAVMAYVVGMMLRGMAA